MVLATAKVADFDQTPDQAPTRRTHSRGWLSVVPSDYACARVRARSPPPGRDPRPADQAPNSPLRSRGWWSGLVPFYSRARACARGERAVSRGPHDDSGANS
jgi:hypothetical protein